MAEGAMRPADGPLAIRAGISNLEEVLPITREVRGDEHDDRD
jgi:hypothetical protein